MEIFTSAPKVETYGPRFRGKRRPSTLSMYSKGVEFQKLSLDQFAKLGWDRVRMLQKLDELSNKPDLPVVERNAQLTATFNKHLESKPQKTFKSVHFDTDQLVLNDETKDSLSHAIVRLAYCRSAELRNWMLTQEVELFKWRFQKKLGSVEQAAFVKSCGDLGDECHVMTQAEFRKYGADLPRATRTSEDKGARPHFFYKIKFEHVVDLVRKRQVLMAGGWAFVHRDHIVGMLAGIFRARLSRALVQLAKKWPSFARVERDRLLPIVAQLTADRRQLANPVDDKAVLQTFQKYIQRLGHSEFKTKQLGRDTVSLGQWRKPNEVDKQCPFAHRIHKSNTVFYTVYLADKVMVQRCWDSDCRHGRRFFQIRGGKVVDLHFTAPNRQQMSEAEKKLLAPVKREPQTKTTESSSPSKPAQVKAETTP